MTNMFFSAAHETDRIAISLFPQQPFVTLLLIRYSTHLLQLGGLPSEATSVTLYCMRTTSPPAVLVDSSGPCLGGMPLEGCPDRQTATGHCCEMQDLEA